LLYQPDRSDDFLNSAKSPSSSVPRENFDDGKREFAIRDIDGYIFQFRQEIG
jgi:hypothetical protein